MAGVPPEQRSGNTTTIDVTSKALVFEGLNDYQKEQVREIVREEIAKALASLIEASKPPPATG